MLDATVPTVDFSQENSCLLVYPRLPILSSYQADWQGIYLGQYLQPAHETPEYISKQYVICINTGQQGIEERWWGEGYYQKEYVICGDISIYPADCPQKQRWHTDCECIELYIEPAMLSSVVWEVSQLSDNKILPHITIRDPLVQNIGLALRQELLSTFFCDRLYVESLTNALIVHLIKHYCTQNIELTEDSSGLPKQQLKTAIAYIRDRLDCELTLAEIAAQIAISPHYFASLFKRSTGQTPHQYITALRIEEAKRLLAKQELAIADIAYRVGFQSQSHFTKVFRRHTKITPKVYRDFH